MSKAPQILVTGGAGYIGSHTCKALARAGDLPVTLDNMVHGHRVGRPLGTVGRRRHPGPRPGRAHHSRASRRCRGALRGHAYVGESMRDPGKYFGNNVAGRPGAAGGGAGLRRRPHRLFLDFALPTASPNRCRSTTGMRSARSTRTASRSYSSNARSIGTRWRTACVRWPCDISTPRGADLDGEIGEDHAPETHLIPARPSARRWALVHRCRSTAPLSHS
jgi:UDP-arabinose 4-epimerase